MGRVACGAERRKGQTTAVGGRNPIYAEDEKWLFDGLFVLVVAFFFFFKILFVCTWMSFGYPQSLPPLKIFFLKDLSFIKQDNYQALETVIMMMTPMTTMTIMILKRMKISSSDEDDNDDKEEEEEE